MCTTSLFPDCYILISLTASLTELDTMGCPYIHLYQLKPAFPCHTSCSYYANYVIGAPLLLDVHTWQQLCQTDNRQLLNIFYAAHTILMDQLLHTGKVNRTIILFYTLPRVGGMLTQIVRSCCFRFVSTSCYTRPQHMLI